MASYGNIIARIVDAAFQAARDLVRAVAYVQPASFNPATGLCLANESMVSASMMILTLRPREWDLVVTQPGDERALVRSSELGAIKPVAGHYFCELVTGLRRDVLSARLDPTAT